MMNLISLQKKIGRCPRCIRASLRAAFGTSAAAALVWTLIGPSFVAYSAAICAALLISLWILHLAMFAFRANIQTRALRANRGIGFKGEIDISRRRQLIAFGQSFAAIAVLSLSIPGLKSHGVVNIDCNQFDSSPQGHCVSRCEDLFIHCIGAPGKSNYDCHKIRSDCLAGCGC
jgi:hypothetical protein